MLNTISASLPRLVVVSNCVAVPELHRQSHSRWIGRCIGRGVSRLRRALVRLERQVAAQPNPQPRIVDKEDVQYALLDLTPRQLLARTRCAAMSAITPLLEDQRK
jgi:hypothetical protein